MDFKKEGDCGNSCTPDGPLSSPQPTTLLSSSSLLQQVDTYP